MVAYSERCCAVCPHLLLISATPARGLRDHARPRRLVEPYKAATQLSDKVERISSIDLHRPHAVFGIVPLNKVCVTPKASVGFHQAYYDKAYTFGVKVTSASGTRDLMSYYPPAVKDWITKNGGLTTTMKKAKYGWDLWMMIDPCPDEW